MLWVKEGFLILAGQRIHLSPPSMPHTGVMTAKVMSEKGGFSEAQGRLALRGEFSITLLQGMMLT